MTTVVELNRKSSSDAPPRSRAASAPATRLAATSAVGQVQPSANAAVFVAGGAEVIETWARQATFASGLGGGLGEDLHAPLVHTQRKAAQSGARHALDLVRAAWRRLHACISAWWAEQRAIARARVTARELAALDDRQLHDIGLERSEILSAALESERRIANPSTRLHTQRLA